MGLVYWTVLIGVGGAALFLAVGGILYHLSSPEEKAKINADAETLRTPLKERLGQAGFSIDKLYDVRRRGISLDIKRQRIVLFSGADADLQTHVISFSDILGAEVEIVSNTAVTTSGGKSLTGAVLGGAVAGPAGMMLGGLGNQTKSREIETIRAVNLLIKVDDLESPLVSVPLLKTDWAGLDQNSRDAIPAAREWKAIIDTVVHRQASASR